MKLIVIFAVTFVASTQALPFGHNFLEDEFGPFNRVRWPSSRIVGGVETDIASHPFQGSLQRNQRHICGCNIISPKFILTAGEFQNELKIL